MFDDLSERAQPARRRAAVALLFVGAVWGGCGSPTPSPVVAPTVARARCVPRCYSEDRCRGLNDALHRARQRFIRCVGQNVERNHLGKARDCHRAVYLMRSAIWWLETVGGLGVDYPADGWKKLNFLCKIEELVEETDPLKVEACTVELVRAFP